MLGLFSELDLCYCTLFVFVAVFSTPSLSVLSYCMFHPPDMAMGPVFVTQPNPNHR